MKRTPSTYGSKLALAIGSALAFGVVSGPAGASVYGGARLLIQNLTIDIFDSAGTELNAGAGNFQFSLENTSTLNGAAATAPAPPPALQLNAFCSGLPGIPGVGTNNCAIGPPTLDATTANAPDGTVSRANNDFAYFGPGGEQYATADSVIESAQLTFDPQTVTKQIAEAELQRGESASANAEIQSTTALSLVVNLPEGPNAGGPYRLDLAFEADPDLMAEIQQDAGFQGGNTQSNVNMTFGLTQTATGDQISWTPQGSATNNCDVDAGLGAAGVTCVEIADEEDLNRTLSVSDNPATATFSRDNNSYSAFRVTLSGLPAGTYSLSLNALTSLAMNQRYDTPVSVPAVTPAILSLLALGLLGIGMSRLRRS